jgi:hypothetical protein
MSNSADVDAWFAQLDHPLKPVMQLVRETILGADARIHEVVKYGTVSFECGSPMGSFVQVKEKKHVSLMFNAAGRLTGSFPHLEGKSVKYLRFKDAAQVESTADELRAITRAWCDLTGPRT